MSKLDTTAAETKALDRRRLLKGLTTGAAGSAAVVATAVSLVEPAVAAETETEKRKARYKVTEHVKAFYRTNRY
jgi:hypothetical protein